MEAELIDNHREEVSQLKKLVAQKEEDLHKTVQKYEQVLQVVWNRKMTFCLDFNVYIYIYIKIYLNISRPHLEAISVGSCPLGCGCLLAACHMNSSTSSINNTHHMSIC